MYLRWVFFFSTDNLSLLGANMFSPWFGIFKAMERVNPLISLPALNLIEAVKMQSQPLSSHTRRSCRFAS